MLKKLMVLCISLLAYGCMADFLTVTRPDPNSTVVLRDKAAPLVVSPTFTVYLYAEANYNAPYLDEVETTTRLKVLASNAKWYRVQTRTGSTGWIPKRWTQLATVKTTPVLAKGEFVEAALTEEAPAEAIATVPPQVYAKHEVALYQTAAFGAHRLKQYPFGAMFRVLGLEDDFWYRVRASDGRQGYISRFWVTAARVDLAAEKQRAQNTEAETRRTIARLEARVQPLPAANVDENLRLYEQLARLDPKNRRYRAKVSHYRRQWDIQQRALRAKRSFTLKEWRWQAVENRVVASGRVQNRSRSLLKMVAVKVTFYNRTGQIAATARAFLDADPLLPGSTSTFTAETVFDPQIADATVSFVSMTKPVPTYFEGSRIAGRLTELKKTE